MALGDYQQIHSNEMPAGRSVAFAFVSFAVACVVGLVVVAAVPASGHLNEPATISLASSSGRSIAELVTIVYRVLLIFLGVVTTMNVFKMPQSVCAIAGTTEDEILAYADGAMGLPNGREIFQAFVILARIEHMVIGGACCLFGSAFTFIIPFGEAYPAFFIIAMAWTLAWITHIQALLTPSKYVYGIKFTNVLMILDPTLAALGWFSFYASKVGL